MTTEPRTARSPADYFPMDFEGSRERFRQRLREARGQIQLQGSWKVPTKTAADLSVDYAYFAPTQTCRRLFVLSSGVHGLEAYAGSAIQEMFFEEILPGLDRSHSGLLLVHSLNPYGFKFHRRCTENGVNLNRNCSVVPGFFDTPNAESLRMSEQFIPGIPVSSLTSPVCQLLNTREGKRYLGDLPMDTFIKTTGLGQFQSPSGLEYGGRQLEPQIANLVDLLRVLIPLYRDIILLDLHTGLGEKGRLHLLTGDTPGSIDRELFRELLDPEKEQDIYEFTDPASEGFYATHGALNNIFPELTGEGQRVCALTLEFGTLGHDPAAQIESLNRWMLEHQGELYGYATEELATQVRRLYLDKFYPQEDGWKNQVLEASRRFFGKVFRPSGVPLP